MRACFLGQHVCALGFGIAALQLPPLPPEKPEAKKADIVRITARKKRAPKQAPKEIDQKLAS